VRIAKVYTDDFIRLLRKYRREYGYNEGTDIAKWLAKQWGIPVYRKKRPKQRRYKRQNNPFSLDFDFLDL